MKHVARIDAQIIALGHRDMPGAVEAVVRDAAESVRDPFFAEHAYEPGAVVPTTGYWQVTVEHVDAPMPGPESV